MSAVSVEPDDADTSKSLPRRIGRYEIVGFLAAGGMAEVLLGRIVGPSGFERVVVVKRILPHLAREQRFVDMFLDEARIVARIHHPNVIQVNELGQADDELFLAMEHVEGESVGGLSRRLQMRGESLTFALAGYIVAEAAAGLHAAHELTDDDGHLQNVVHRDVSPQNLIVTYAGGVKVLDFGIATASDRIVRTEAGQLKGKFAYMSPEQCRGEALDRRSDVFALGTVLYELTTGRRLFKRASQLASLKAITGEPIVPPSRLVPDYPPALESICLRALKRKPDERHATAAELRSELLAAIRALDPSLDAPVVLAARMRELFADRIEEKREMLRRVRGGTSFVRAPPAETDAAVELPTVETAIEAASDETQSSMQTDSSARARRARGRAAPRRAWPLFVGGALAGSVIAAAIFAFRSPPPAGPTAGGTAAFAPAPALEAPPGATAREAASAAPEATEVVLRFESTPPDAEVTLAGAPIGNTPLERRVPAGPSPLVVTISRAGFSRYVADVVPSAPRTIAATLAPLGRPERAGLRPRPDDPGPAKATPSAHPPVAAPAPVAATVAPVATPTPRPDERPPERDPFGKVDH